MHKSLHYGALFALLNINPPVFADNATTESLPEVVITATRTDTPTNQLTAGATVFTREDIEQKQFKTLPELLRTTTGIDLTQSGGDGKTSSVFMRGTDSSHVLVLIDGIKVGSVSLGSTPFELIPTDQIERVEIIRGPNSSLYGSEAIGGVIQIFTRKGGNTQTPKVTLDAGGGNYSTLKTAGNVSGEWQNTWYNVGASHYNTQGFSANIKGDQDDDAYYNTAVNARIGHRFDNKAEVEASFLRSAGKTEIDRGPDWTKFLNQTAALSGSLYLTDAWKSTLRLGQSMDNNNTYFPASSFGPAFNTIFNTTRWNATWLNQYQVNDNHQIVLGSDYRFDELDSTTTFAKNSRYDVGVFGELHSQLFDDHFVNASVRYDHNEAFGDYVTGNIGWRYNSPIGISPFASFGSAFKAPTLNDLYYQDNFGSHGDPNLKPEESTTVEVGLAGNHDWAQWEVRAYHTNIDNLIIWDTDPNTFISIPHQRHKVQIDGIEAEISTQLLGWNHKLGMQLLNPQERATGLRLPRRADKILTYDLSRSFGNFDVGAYLMARGNSFEEDFLHNRTEVPGFVTVDLRTAYHIDKNWMISAKLNNLFDKQYQTVYSYNTADRNFFISIHYNN